MDRKVSLQQEIETCVEKGVSFSTSYFPHILDVVRCFPETDPRREKLLSLLYALVHRQIVENTGKPLAAVTFGTSGWRGILGLDLFCRSVMQVVCAIMDMYAACETDATLAEALGVQGLVDAKKRGCVVGFDNRFCGYVFAAVAIKVLLWQGFRVFYAGETTTGVLSASVLQLQAAFSINFTPSHNPLEYGGLKYNAADAGPASARVTNFITQRANEIITEAGGLDSAVWQDPDNEAWTGQVVSIDSFALWQRHVVENREKHGIDYLKILDLLQKADDVVLALDSVHGASRIHIPRMFAGISAKKMIHLRSHADVTFGGIAPEPSSANMESVVKILQKRPERLRIGAIIDPDGDRIRFTDGDREISMNQFGAMAFHYLHDWKKKKGMVAKTVATSNLANVIAAKIGEKVFESRVGFKEFKPVIGQALVCFEESDGISVLGHTPEKDAYIGLFMALDMVLHTGKNLGEYLEEIEQEYGYYYPGRAGIRVAVQGDALLLALSQLDKYQVGSLLPVGKEKKIIKELIVIDGRKMIFEDGSWLMIRPSGTEPKVRLYVEARTTTGAADLLASAHNILKEIGIL